MQEASDWELYKENIQPLKKGRVMADLQSALLPTGESSVRPALLQKKREFEVLLRSYVGEDPLEPWRAYIDWTEQNFPKGGKEGSLSELLQHCIMTFKDDPRYANDKRFVDICLKFADLAPDVMEVYQYMYSVNIGVLTAAFYRSWALQHENLGNIKKAEALFVEGINRCAQPKEELEMSHKQFTARILNNMHEKAEPTSPQQSPEAHRTALGGLKGVGKKQHVGSTRTGAAKLSNNQGVHVQTDNGSNARPSFSIFCDENVAQPSVLPPKSSVLVAPPAMASAKKENERKAEKWTDVKVRQRVISTPSANQRVFSVHIDEMRCTPQQTPSQKVLPDSHILSARKADFPNMLEGIRRTAETKEDCRQVAMYCKEKLFCGVTEFQFEELRAIKWWKRQKKLEEERVLKEREMRLKKREEDLENLTARLTSIMAQGGDGMLVELAKCKKQVEDLKLDGQSDSSKSASSEQLDGPSVEEAAEDKVPQNLKGTDSNCSSAASSQTKTPRIPSPCSTGNTAHFVRAMFNGTLVEGAEDEPPLAGERTNLNPSSRKKCSFTVYGDDDARHEVGSKNLGAETPVVNNPVSSGQENHPFRTDETEPSVVPAVTAMKPDPDDVENVQNVPPIDYNSNKSCRKFTGILKPSDVLRLSEEGEAAFEVNNDFVIVQPLAGREITMSFPSNVSFANNLKISSTPCDSMPHGSAKSTSENRWNWNARNVANQPAKSLGTQGGNEQFFKTPGARSIAPTMNFQRFSLQAKCDLSLISEASNEYKSSSSSGSSGAATSHFKSQFLRNKTQDETPSIVDRSDKSKVLAQRDCPLNGEGGPFDYSDPFKVEITDAILENLTLPLSARKGYCELMRSLPMLKENSHVQMENDMYCIDKLCNSGGFAKIFCGSEMGFNSWQNNKAKKLAFKVQRPACRWEFYVASELLSRIKQLQNPVDVTPSVMQISKIYVYKSGSILVTEYHKHGTLVDVVNYFGSRNTSIPEALALYFTIEMLYIVENLHACRIIHADIKPDNFLIMSLSNTGVNVSEKTFEKVFGRQTRCLKLIDFGRSIDMAVLPPGTTFTKSVKTDMFECCEMKEGRPWTYQTDFYGLASCSHTLLFGNYMKTVKQGDSWKINATLKRYWHQTEWTNLFHRLLNVPNCESQPDAAALRQSLEDCLLTKKLLPELCSVLKQLEDVLGKRSGPMFP